MASNSKKITVCLDPEDPIVAAYLDFARTALPEHPPAAAIREAILAYAGTDPLEAARSAARRATLLLERRRAVAIIARIMRETADGYERTLGTIDEELREFIAAHPDLVQGKAA